MPHVGSQSKEGYGVFPAFASIIKCNWGIGMMAMPFYLQSAGLLTGVIFFAVTMYLTDLTIGRLLLSRDVLLQRRIMDLEGKYSMTNEPNKKAQDETLPLVTPTSNHNKDDMKYGAIIAMGLGNKASMFGLVSIAISSFGSCVAYMEYIKDNMTKFVGLNEWQWVCIVSFPMLFMAMFDNLDCLSRLSALGLMCALSFEGIILYKLFDYMSLHSIWDFIESAPQLTPDLSTLPVALGIAVFCNEGCVVLSSSVQQGMSEPHRFRKTIKFGLFFFTINYMAVAIAGYTLFQDDTQSEISLNFTLTTINRVAAVLYALQLIPTYGIVYFMCYESLENWYFSRGPGKHIKRSRFCVKSIRMFFVLVSAVISLTIPNFGNFLALIGAFCNSAIIYVLPHLTYARVLTAKNDDAMRKEVQRGMALLSHLTANKRKCHICQCYLFVLFGATTGILGTVVAAKNLITNK